MRANELTCSKSRRKSWALHLTQELLKVKRMVKNQKTDQMESFAARTGEISLLT
jgi:hypothetical protein